MSRWPVAGGVVVANGVVYAAAGLAHYDGTHVFALDAVTGKVKWHNSGSGSISPYKSGISLQGQLQIADGKLSFCGGNAYPEAIFDLKTGRCLSTTLESILKVKNSGMKASTFYAVDSYLKKIRERTGKN